MKPLPYICPVIATEQLAKTLILWEQVIFTTETQKMFMQY